MAQPTYDQPGRELPAPPLGEEIHLPGPTVIPLLNAVGVSVAVVGLTVNWIITAIGLALVLVTTIRWIRDVRRDIDELPPEHHHPH